MSDQKQNITPIKLPENVPTDWQFEKMLKSFMKDIDKTGILKEVKIRRYYRKPSEIKREHLKKIKR